MDLQNNPAVGGGWPPTGWKCRSQYRHPAHADLAGAGMARAGRVRGTGGQPTAARSARATVLPSPLPSRPAPGAQGRRTRQHRCVRSGMRQPMPSGGAAEQDGQADRGDVAEPSMGHRRACPSGARSGPIRNLAGVPVDGLAWEACRRDPAIGQPVSLLWLPDRVHDLPGLFLDRRRAARHGRRHGGRWPQRGNGSERCPAQLRRLRGEPPTVPGRGTATP
jgi:hypothetical protein